MMLVALMVSATSMAQGIKGTVIDENGEAVIAMRHRKWPPKTA